LAFLIGVCLHASLLSRIETGCILQQPSHTVKQVNPVVFDLLPKGCDRSSRKGENSLH